MEKKKGFFITLEGLDGSGKTVIGGLFADALREMGYSVLTTREPGGSVLGREIRTLLLNYRGDHEGLTREAEALLFLADRAQHVADTIIPALAEGRIVICDRYTDSTLAYQGGGRGMDMAVLSLLNDFSSVRTRPDLTFYLTTPQEVSEMRRNQSPDRMEKEDRAFFYRVEAAYDEIAKSEPERVYAVDANRDKYVVKDEMIKIAKGRLSSSGLIERDCGSRSGR